MSILKKMKDILFEEEEVILEKPEEKPISVKPREKEVKESEPILEKVKAPVVQDSLEDTKELTSPFIDFDEDEFENSMPYVPSEPRRSEIKKMSEPVRKKPAYTEYERKVTVEKKYDAGRYEKIEKTEIKDKIKFKPSLIISPVYGVLNEDYTPDDIKHKGEVTSGLNIDEVRKKAYGELDAFEEKMDEPVEMLIEEKTTVTLRPNYESDEKVKSIEELLSITSDERIEVNDKYFDDENSFGVTEELNISEVKKRRKTEVFDEEDTLENDLFDLIDSMYENKEEVI